MSFRLGSGRVWGVSSFQNRSGEGLPGAIYPGRHELLRLWGFRLCARSIGRVVSNRPNSNSICLQTRTQSALGLEHSQPRPAKPPRAILVVTFQSSGISTVIRLSCYGHSSCHWNASFAYSYVSTHGLWFKMLHIITKIRNTKTLRKRRKASGKWSESFSSQEDFDYRTRAFSFCPSGFWMGRLL